MALVHGKTPHSTCMHYQLHCTQHSTRWRYTLNIRFTSKTANHRHTGNTMIFRMKYLLHQNANNIINSCADVVDIIVSAHKPKRK